MSDKKTMIVRVSILVGAVLLLPAACSIQVDQGGQASGGSGEAPSCAPVGAKCTIASDCCSQGCPNGACGMPSGSGSCKPGDAPVLLASSPGYAQALAIDATWVYYSVSQNVTCGSALMMRVPKAGGTPELIGATKQPSFALAVDETSVYWSDSPDDACTNPDGAAYAMFRGPKDMEQPNALTGTKYPPAINITLDTTRVYWAFRGSGIVHALKTGEDAKSIGWGAAVTVNATDIYWTSGGIPGDNKAGDYVMGMAKTGGDATPLAYVPATYSGGAAGYGGITSDADSAYFIQFVTCDWYGKDCSYADSVQRVSMSDAGSGELARFADMWPGNIVVDRENVYWTETSMYNPSKPVVVMRVPKVGGEAQMIASSPDLDKIAVDDTCVYWTGFSTGSVWKGPK